MEQHCGTMVMVLHGYCDTVTQQPTATNSIKKKNNLRCNKHPVKKASKHSDG